jgi:hypothetical protein
VQKGFSVSLPSRKFKYSNNQQHQKCHRLLLLTFLKLKLTSLINITIPTIPSSLLPSTACTTLEVFFSSFRTVRMQMLKKFSNKKSMGLCWTRFLLQSSCCDKKPIKFILYLPAWIWPPLPKLKGRFADNLLTFVALLPSMLHYWPGMTTCSCHS